MIVGAFQVRGAVNWPQLAEELRPVGRGLPGFGFSHETLPGPVNLLADVALPAGRAAEAQAIADAHVPRAASTADPIAALARVVRGEATAEDLGVVEQLSRTDRKG
jgi:hypothetical protein